MSLLGTVNSFLSIHMAVFHASPTLYWLLQLFSKFTIALIFLGTLHFYNFRISFLICAKKPELHWICRSLWELFPSYHVAGRSLITCLSYGDPVTERCWSRDCAVSDHVAEQALISWLCLKKANEFSGLISFRIDWIDLLAVQGTLKSLLQHYSSKSLMLFFFFLECWCACVSFVGCVWLSATPRTAAHQAPLSEEFYRQEYWNWGAILFPRGFSSYRDQTWATREAQTHQNQIRSDQISHSVVSDSLWPHESQHARPPCP